MSESASAGSAPLPATALMTDQRRRWEQGERVMVEEYLREQPALSAEPETILDLLYHEILLREARGETPHLDEYLRRFPLFPEQLRLHFEVHAALDAVSDTFAGYGTRAAPAAAPVVWPTVPGYEILAMIGRGGMGVVYKARHQGLNRLVALKMLGDNWSGDPDRLARFRGEAEAVARLQSPSIVQIHDIGGVNGHPYFALELIDGGSLAEHLRGSPAPQRQAAALVESVARAIHHAHERGIVHRDLKPANILLQRDEGGGLKDESEAMEVESTDVGSSLFLHPSSFIPKITDFGLAKFLGDRPSAAQTKSGDILGTPSYMAPEQTSSVSGSIGPATDIYALGAVLYEMLTGRPPFRGVSCLDTLQQVRYAAPVPPRRLQPGIALDLETVCLKCLEKEPGKRYSTALALADDLARFLAGRPIKARAVGQGEKLLRWCRRRPGVAALLAGLVLVFLAGSSGVLWQWQRASRNAVAYRQERDTAHQEKLRAEHHLQMVRDRVVRLDQMGHDLLKRPGQYRTGQAVLEEALRFYQEMLPEEGSDPSVRHEAANLYSQVAHIYIDLGNADKAAEAFGRQASLLTTLLDEDPASKALRMELADSHRWRGNALRDLGKTGEARAAYDQAAELHGELVREYPDEVGYEMALANTLLNKASLFSSRDQPRELESLLRRAVELDRAAVRAAPANPTFNAELALALGDLGLFYLDTGRVSQAEAAVREAGDIYQKIQRRGRLKGYVERYVGNNFVKLGHVLTAADKAREAEQAYKTALNLLTPLAEDVPESGIRRADLTQALADLADLFTDLGRRQEAEEIRRRVIRQYERLKADFPQEPNYGPNLVLSYLRLVNSLWQVGRQTEANELYRKALHVDPADPAVNKELAWFLATNPEPRLRDAPLAVRLAKQAVTARPEFADYRNALGVAHYRNGDDQAAVAELEKAMSLRAGGDSFDLFFLAMAHWRLGDHDPARTLLGQAVQGMSRHNPHDGELRRFRAEAQAMLTGAANR